MYLFACVSCDFHDTVSRGRENHQSVVLTAISNGAYGDGGDDGGDCIRHDFHGALLPVMNMVARASTALLDNPSAVEEGNGAPAEGVDSVVEEDNAVAVVAEDIVASLVVDMNVAGVDKVYTLVVDQLEAARSGHVVKMPMGPVDKGSLVVVEGM